MRHAGSASALPGTLVAYRKVSFPWLSHQTRNGHGRWNAHGFDDTALLLRLYQRTRREVGAANFPMKKPPVELEVVVVGAGISGLSFAAEYVSQGGKAVGVLEKSTGIGGVWTVHANSYSRVQTAEPAYRLPCLAHRAGVTHQTYAHEVVRDLKKMVARHGLSVFTEASVREVSKAPTTIDRGQSSWRVSGRQRGSQFQVSAQVVMICVNRKLSSTPNSLTLVGQERFQGVVRRGLAGDTGDVVYAERRVIILGFGAFAVENMRNALERGAMHTLLLCRRRGTVCPKPVDWLNYVRPFDGGLRRDKKGDAVLWASWVLCYTSTGTARPEIWKQGKVKHDGHGISVANLFFIAVGSK
jgi:cation diffusion facilitator CzcD-associated flavoprotein CzcO